MSGSRYVFDTNAIVALLQGNAQLIQLILTATDVALIHRIIEIRQQHRLKLPDAVIAAMTIHHSASLVTADQEFSKVNSLSVIHW
jgi:hypothetical protein